MSVIASRLNNSTSPWSARQLARRTMLRCAPRRRIFESLPGSEALYLTFDDGPHPVYTPKLLDVLGERGVRATFFVVGRQCEEHPQIVRRILAEGHALGNHSYSHPDPRSLSASALWAEVERTNNVLEKIVGTRTRLFRPPHGKLALRHLLRLWQGGQTVALWNIDPKDYACDSAEELIAWFAARPFRAGDVILLHDSKPWAPDVLPRIANLLGQSALQAAALRMSGKE